RRLLPPWRERLTRGHETSRGRREVMTFGARSARGAHRFSPTPRAHALEGEEKIVNIAGAMHLTGFARDDEIRTAADVLADDGGQSGRHRLVHDEPPRFVGVARQHETIRRGVDLAEPALIHEAERREPDAEIGC